jgi:hypothetical protein
MTRNALAIAGAVFLLSIFRGYLTPKIPLLVKVPLPQISFNSAKPSENKPELIEPAPTYSPSPQPTATPEQKKRWGLEFEYKGRVGL